MQKIASKMQKALGGKGLSCVLICDQIIYMSSYLSLFKCMVSHIFICTHLLRDQFSVGLIAQLVEHCTRSPEIMGLNPIQA